MTPDFFLFTSCQSVYANTGNRFALQSHVRVSYQWKDMDLMRRCLICGLDEFVSVSMRNFYSVHILSYFDRV